ncbi:MAG: hypothetical protein HN348_15150 [Proteobacteria bacterium]|nr:hypothetical protein [Pseudomonadota bacterium]
MTGLGHRWLVVSSGVEGMEAWDARPIDVDGLSTWSTIRDGEILGWFERRGYNGGMGISRTLGHVASQPPHHSFWRSDLERRATPLQDYLISQANVRGFMGAWSAGPVSTLIDHDLTLEEIVVGLCTPHSPAEARVFKLLLRILQSGRIDVDRLHWLARRERAQFVLHWLTLQVPEGERNDEFQKVAKPFEAPPRGYRPLTFNYDGRRLIRRPWRMEDGWPTQRS